MQNIEECVKPLHWSFLPRYKQVKHLLLNFTYWGFRYARFELPGVFRWTTRETRLDRRGHHTHRNVCASSCLVADPEGTKGVCHRSPWLC